MEPTWPHMRIRLRSWLGWICNLIVASLTVHRDCAQTHLWTHCRRNSRADIVVSPQLSTSHCCSVCAGVIMLAIVLIPLPIRCHGFCAIPFASASIYTAKHALSASVSLTAGSTPSWLTSLHTTSTVAFSKAYRLLTTSLPAQDLHPEGVPDPRKT